MVKMINGGITIEVPESDVDYYKRAGYSVVVETPAPPASVEIVADESKPAPKKKTS